MRIHMSKEIIPIERIRSPQFVFREQKVLLDSDLARLYGVSTGHLNQAVKRNLDVSHPISCSSSRPKRCET